jgi:plastocyanin
MIVRFPLRLAAVCAALTACAPVHSLGTAPKAPLKAADSAKQALASIERTLPAGTRVYETDSVRVHDGDTVALFSAAARVTRTASGVTVYDVQSKQTFTFSPRAQIDYTNGTSRVYVVPGERAPSWLRESHVRSERVL